MTTPTELAQRLHTALSTGNSGDQLASLLTEDVMTREYPNLIRPAGGQDDLAGMKAGSQSGAALLRSQTYDVHEAYDQGDTAIVRLTWTGVVGRDVGGFAAGQVITAHIAQFIGTRDGKICSIATYDCYEPFTRAQS